MNIKYHLVKNISIFNMICWFFSAFKIHCSKQCKELLTQLGGYYLIERGLVPMKGKGEQQTYWLLGEDEEIRAVRSVERQKRRAVLSGKSVTNGLDSNGHCIIPRSSLKNKSNMPKSPIPRCSSFESPKRLRFANNENTKNRDFLEVIIDSPCKKSVNSLLETTIDFNSNAWKISSTSCPCIENLANSTATLAYSQLSMFTRDEKFVKICTKQSCSSFPVLFPHLSVPRIPIIKTISAPCSPKKERPSILSNLHEYEELVAWADSAPLLKISEVDDHESKL